MIEVLMALNMLYAMLLYRNGKKNVAGFTIVFTLLSAAFYFANFFLDEYSKFLVSQYGQSTYFEIVSYIEILTAADSLPAAMNMLMLLSIAVNFIFSLQYTVLVAFAAKVEPLTVGDFSTLTFSLCEKEEEKEYNYSTRPTTLAHLRI